MMALPQWTLRTLVLVALTFAIGGFFVGSASSQQDRPRPAVDGSYQMLALPGNDLFVFDTKTAQYWTNRGDGGWERHPGPLVAATREMLLKDPQPILPESRR